MHTFFINTSKKSPISMGEFLDIHILSKEFISLDCPIGGWMDESGGYNHIVRTVGELIDTYADITGDFNLLLLVDLSEIEEYSALPTDDDIDRTACADVLGALFLHYINRTLLQGLTLNCRTPRQITVIFKDGMRPVAIDRNSEGYIASRNKYFKKLCGLPDAALAESVISELSAESELGAGEQLVSLITERGFEPFLEGLYECCLPEFDVFAKGQIRSREEDRLPDSECEGLISNILSKRTEMSRTVKFAHFHVNPTATATNRRERAMCELRFILYLLECLQEGSLWVTAPDGRERARDFAQLDAREVGAVLTEKYRMYLERLGSLESDHEDLGLIPPLRGIRSDIFKLTDTATDKKRTSRTPVRSGRMTRLINIRAFEERFEGESETEAKPKTADDWRERARSLCESHGEYLESINNYLKDVLTSYTGHTDGIGKPPVFGKRTIREDGLRREDSRRDVIFEDITPDADKSRVDAKGTSARVYREAEKNYMDYCRARSVSVSDFSTESDAYLCFEKKIGRIEKSITELKKVGFKVLLPLGIAILFVLPYVLIQMLSLFSNALSIIAAAACAVLPFAIFGTALGIAVARQKEQYELAWIEFKAASDNALKDNRTAMSDFEDYLAVYAPSLRWAHEYCCEVGSHEESVSIANAKITHHRNMIERRIAFIQTVLGEIEIRPERVACDTREGHFNCNLPYCEGEENRNFYSVIDMISISKLRGGRTE